MKTCNLFTVKNTPSEARRDTPTVDYYYIDFFGETKELDVPRWRTLSDAIETIWESISISDMDCLDGHSIYAYMTDRTRKPVLFMRVDRDNRELRICRVD